MDDSNDWIARFNSPIRRLLRQLAWLIFMLAFFGLFIFSDESWSLLLLPLPMLWWLLITPAFLCPRCGSYIRRLPQGIMKDSENMPSHPFVLWGFLEPDGTCWNCGVLLKRKRKKNILKT